MANLALRSASEGVLPPDVAISGNPFLACTSIEALAARTVYTTPNGRAELVESGCSPGIAYVEDGELLPSPTISYFGLRTNVVEKTSSSGQGFRFLLRGFLPPQQWGTWAGGYRSAVGFEYEEVMLAPLLSLRMRSNPDDPDQRTVVIRANHREVGRKQLSFDQIDVIDVPLPSGQVGTRVELTITCERTEQEVLADDPVDGPDACVGLESFTLREGSVSSQ
jgi:hypothetical protein